MSEQPKTEDLLWHRQHSARNDLIPKVLEHANKVYGEVAIYEAWDEFHGWECDPFDPNSPELQIFMPWFYYDWTPDPDMTEVNEDAPVLIPPAKALLLSKASSLNAFEKEYITACLGVPFSFLEITSCHPGQGFTLRDIFTQREYDVTEKLGSENASIGDILFGKPVTVRGLTTLEACSHFMIPPVRKKPLLDFRALIEQSVKPITEEVLEEFQEELLEMFQDFQEALLHPKPPTLTNTDGDLFVPHQLIFEIDSATAVFEALSGLCIQTTQEMLLKNATLSQDGSLTRIEFPWLRAGNKKHKEWENTVLGHIIIDGQTLTVDVNSEKRAKKFKSELKKRMTGGWKYKTTVIESVESKMASSPTSSQKESDQLLEQHPEIRDQQAKMMEAHWNNWLTQKIPTLGNRTPIQAAKTRDGREMLQALLTQFERHALDRPQPGVTLETFKSIRNKLGIEEMRPNLQEEHLR